MYLGDLQLSGVSEWKGFGGDGAVNQAAVDARWNEIGLSPPAPLVPASLLGLYVFETRVGPRVALTRNIKNLRKSPSAGFFTKQENDFWNFFGKVAIDPQRKETGISKVAGGILKVAAVAIPAFSYFQAAGEAANVGLAYGQQGANESLAERALEPAVTQSLAAEQARDDATFAAQMQKIQSLAPGAASVVMDTSPIAPAIVKKPSVPLPLMIAGALVLLGAILT